MKKPLIVVVLLLLLAAVIGGGWWWAFTVFADGHGAQEGENNNAGGFGNENGAIEGIVAEHVAAVVRQRDPYHGVVHALRGPQDGAGPEVLVTKKRGKLGFYRYVSLFLSRFDDHLLFAFIKAKQQQQQRQKSPNRHGFDPRRLIVAKVLHQRQCAGNGENTTKRRHRHSGDAEHIPFPGGAGHHRREAAVGEVDGGIAHGGAEVIGDQQIEKLQRAGGLRDGEQ